MKITKYIIMFFACLALASCMDDGYGTPSEEENFFGNEMLTESNVITVAQLKKMCEGEIETQGLKKIEEPTQIKVRVSANDQGGNFYTQFAAEDETGGMLIGVGQGGLYGILPEGQEILLELKDLYIGSYRKQAQIGMPYTSNSGELGIGKIHRALWNNHFKLLSKPSEALQPMEFDLSKVKDKKYLKENNGRLMILKNVELKDADGTAVFAPDDNSVPLFGNAANRAIKGVNSRELVVRTSKYAKFAHETMPTGKVNITGIFTRYNDTWQIMMRTVNDIKKVEK